MNKKREVRSAYATLGRPGNIVILTKKTTKEGSESKTKNGKRKKIILYYPIRTGKKIVQIRPLNNDFRRTEPLLNNVTSKVMGVKIDANDISGNTFWVETENSMYKARFLL